MTDNDSEAPVMPEELALLAQEVTADLDEVESSTEASTTEYRRGSVAFARATEDGLDVRLPADIAEAALRTPDTAPVTGDRGWLRFTPSTDEQHALDRAQAWLLTAWRHAE